MVVIFSERGGKWKNVVVLNYRGIERSARVQNKELQIEEEEELER